MRWEADSIVVHVREGVCRIVSIENKIMTGDEPMEYYLLSPVYDPSSRIYVPTEKGDAFLRDPLTKEEIHELIHMIPDINLEWISDEKTRQRELREDLKSGSHKTLLGIITSLYKKKEEISGTGKKFHTSDEHVLNEAARQIHREFGYVLGMEPDEVPDYIHAILTQEKAQ